MCVITDLCNASVCNAFDVVIANQLKIHDSRMEGLVFAKVSHLDFSQGVCLFQELYNDGFVRFLFET